MCTARLAERSRVLRYTADDPYCRNQFTFSCSPDWRIRLQLHCPDRAEDASLTLLDSREPSSIQSYHSAKESVVTVGQYSAALATGHFVGRSASAASSATRLWSISFPVSKRQNVKVRRLLGKKSGRETIDPAALWVYGLPYKATRASLSLMRSLPVPESSCNVSNSISTSGLYLGLRDCVCPDRRRI